MPASINTAKQEQSRQSVLILIDARLSSRSSRYNRGAYCIAIRSAYRSCEVNGFCNEMQRKKKAGYTCASNESNYAGHIWDRLDAEGHMGAMACVVVPSFWAKHQEPGDWRILARWVHENLPYSTLYFFPTYWAFNIGWHERPERTIKSYAEPAGLFTP